MEKRHPGFLRPSSAFAMIAGSTCRDHIRPDVKATLISGQDVIHCKARLPAATILAGIIVPPEDFPAGQFDMGARSTDLKF
jgi:hypothetical protein